MGVLCEPLSVAEKAIDEAVRLQVARLPDAPASLDWLHDRPCLVAGLGPIGLLAALVLRLRGAQVYGLDVVDADTARPKWLEHIGGKYIDGRQVPADQVDDHFGRIDLIFEATGVAALEFNLLDALAPQRGVCADRHPGRRPSAGNPWRRIDPRAGAEEPGHAGQRQCRPRPLSNGGG